MLACETGSEPVDRLVHLLDSIQSPAIGVAFNPGSLIVQDNYSVDSIRQCARRVLSVVACDGVRDLSIGRGLQVHAVESILVMQVRARHHPGSADIADSLALPDTRARAYAGREA